MINHEALLRLADKLQGRGFYVDVGPVKDAEFDMAAWVERDIDFPECGTAACAVGHAMLDPWFNERGLCGRPILSSSMIPVFCDGSVNWTAVQTFFGLDRSQSALLFYAGSYRDPSRNAVAENIRAFCFNTGAKHAFDRLPAQKETA